jgi:hypothetical protein
MNYFSYNPKALEKMFQKMKLGQQQWKNSPGIKNTDDGVAKSKSIFNSLFVKLNLRDNKSIKKWFQENIVGKKYEEERNLSKYSASLDKLINIHRINPTTQPNQDTAKEPLNQITVNLIN